MLVAAGMALIRPWENIQHEAQHRWSAVPASPRRIWRLIRQHDQLAGTDQQVRDAQGILAWAGMLDLWASIFCSMQGRRLCWPKMASACATRSAMWALRSRAAANRLRWDWWWSRMLRPALSRPHSWPASQSTIEFTHGDGIIGPLAWAAVDLRGYESHRLKRCPRHDCRWLFIDRTNNRSRRWCEWPPAETAQGCDRAGKPTAAWTKSATAIRDRSKLVGQAGLTTAKTKDLSLSWDNRSSRGFPCFSQAIVSIAAGNEPDFEDIEHSV
jgi:hypothetical protein